MMSQPPLCHPPYAMDSELLFWTSTETDGEWLRVCLSKLRQGKAIVSDRVAARVPQLSSLAASPFVCLRSREWYKEW